MSRSRSSPRKKPTNDWVPFISRPRATRLRSDALIAPCATSIRSGIASRRSCSRRCCKADPDCGIAYWGIALSLLNNPHAPPPVGNLPLGLAAVEKAKAVGAKTQRERDFINAMAAFYTDFDKVDHRSRVLAYLKAMEGVAQAYPNDDEAQILYAIELNVAAPPSDKTYAMQLKGAAILEPIFLRQPRHPGVAHYLIHLYDTPALAEKGLDAAKRYAQIAPAAPHAQHMPSHIFTRVGYWKESIGSNAEAARSAKASNEAHDELHAMDYLVYAYLQMGQDGKAQAVHPGDARHRRLHRDVHRRSLCAGREPGALCGRARRLERGSAACRCGRARWRMLKP